MGTTGTTTELITDAPTTTRWAPNIRFDRSENRACCTAYGARQRDIRTAISQAMRYFTVADPIRPDKWARVRHSVTHKDASPFWTSAYTFTTEHQLEADVLKFLVEAQEVGEYSTSCEQGAIVLVTKVRASCSAHTE
jgi:hypothetical protein